MPRSFAGLWAVALAIAVSGCNCLDPGGGSDNVPVAVMECDPTLFTIGERITVDATESTDEDGPPAGFCFAFDEPGAPVVRNLSGLATYTYRTPGEHLVRVVVFDNACPLPILSFNNDCEVTNEDDLRAMRSVCTRAIETCLVEVLDIPEAGPDSGLGDGGDAGPPLCLADLFEPNDSLDQATPSATGTLGGLTICDMDVDFFSYALALGDVFQATLATDPAGGDVDAILIDPEGMFVAIASTNEDEYTLQHEVLTTGVYHLEIYGFGGQRGEYDLTVSVF